MELQQNLEQSAHIPFVRVGQDARGSTVWEVVVQVATGSQAVEICEALRQTLDLPEVA